MKIEDRKTWKGFPPVYVPNSVKNSEDYARQMFKAIIEATSSYREVRMLQIAKSRDFARGRQSLQKYLDELNIEGSNQYINISYQPTKILQKFEKIVVDDYQQLKEVPKAVAEAYHIQERKERKKSDLKFRMENRDMIAMLEQQVGFNLENPNEKVPEDEEELELITSLNSEEREELLMRKMLSFVLDDNDIESLKRMFLSDTFQVNFAGYHHYVDRNGRIRVDFVSNEDAIYDNSVFEDFRDVGYAGKRCTMNIADIRAQFNISADKEQELYKLAYTYKNEYGNTRYRGIATEFNNGWRDCSIRPYDDFTVEVFHIWKRTIKNVGYVEGTDSYGKSIFDIDKSIEKVEYKSQNKKRTGTAGVETAYEGWFAGNEKCQVVLEWGESQNQTREGENKEKVLCPYIFFMPENRGEMLDASAVENVIAEVETMDSAMLKIKMTMANHPPVGYAIDPDALMDIDLGDGTLEPLTLESIYQQTGKLYIKRIKEDGTRDNSLPIVPLNLSIADTINTYMLIYNTALNNIRDILGINPFREGTANQSRVSSSNAQQSFAVSQTATYYIYRAFLKATEKLTKHIGIRLIDVLKLGNPNKGYQKYLGKENIDFINERKDLTATSYKFTYSPQITKEDEERLVNMINASISARELSIADALFILDIKDINIASKYMRYFTNKNKKQAHQESVEVTTAQAQSQAEGQIQVEQAKRETIELNERLQANQWKIKGETEIESNIMKIAMDALSAQREGKPLTPKEQELITLVLDDALAKKERSMLETEQQLEAEAMAEQQEMMAQQLQQGVQNGQISEQEAMEVAQQNGLM